MTYASRGIGDRMRAGSDQATRSSTRVRSR